jgi:hypothetical protein
MAASGMALTSESLSMSCILIRFPIFTPHDIAKQLQITFRAYLKPCEVGFERSAEGTKPDTRYTKF